MKVLLATEGSKFSQAAIEKCCKMFDESENTEIRVISAAEPALAPAEPFGVSAEYLREVNSVAVEHANTVVSEAEKLIRDKFPDMGVGLTTKVVKGSPSQAIVEEAEDWGADLIIMGSHGYGFWQRALLGSVSNSVMHHSPCSVLVVRPPKELNGKETG